MTWKKWLACTLVAAALASIGCGRPVVPGRVRARVAWRELDPSGAWVRTEPDGSTSTLTLTRPEGNRQLFGVTWTGSGGASLTGEAFVDGTTVFATRHTPAGANDLCLYLYDRRADGTLEAIWGSAPAIAPVAYEEAHLGRAREGNWNGVYSEWGNNMGGRYTDRLIIGRALAGDPRIHRLHWTQGDHGWYRGWAFEFGEQLVGVRLPGVLVHTSTWSAGAFTVTQTSTEVGRGLYWVLGAYRLDGDALVGMETESGSGALTEVRWSRPGAGGEAPQLITPVQPPAPEPVLVPAPEPAPAPAP